MTLEPRGRGCAETFLPHVHYRDGRCVPVQQLALEFELQLNAIRHSLALSDEETEELQRAAFDLAETTVRTPLDALLRLGASADGGERMSRYTDRPGLSEHPSWWDDLPYAYRIAYDWPDLERFVKLARIGGRNIVLTNGVFDLIHPGHLLKLAHVRIRQNPNDFVIVSLDTDLQVRRDKGRYPALLWRERAPILASLAGVDAVTCHGEGVGPLTALVALLAPCRWHRREDAPLSEVAPDGVEVVRSGRNGPWSSTALRSGYLTAD